LLAELARTATSSATPTVTGDDVIGEVKDDFSSPDDKQ
jgi:hypothetical protein